MKMYLSSICFCLCLSVGIKAHAENKFSVFPDPEYPTDLFSSPIKFPISLAGNYGECRPNHFHSGLDIRTQQVENKPIYAVAPGYVSRIHISHKGYGNALHINHAGGYTSVYAHLNSYNERIEKVVKWLQYYNKKWDIDIYLPFWMLIIPADEQVALSGNTGSSLAPHLHFEIRDTKTGATLNPWLFGFDIPDTSAPQMYALSLYNLDGYQSFYNQEPRYIENLGQGPRYELSETIEFESDYVGIGLRSRDYMDDHFGKLGVFESQLYVDGELYFAWQLDDIHHHDTRYVHALTDFQMYKKKNKWYHYLFRLPGNRLKIFEDPKHKEGYISLADNKVHSVEIKQYDVKGNVSTLNFKIKKKKSNWIAPPCNGHIIQANVENEILVAPDGTQAIFADDIFYAQTCLATTKLGPSKYRIGSEGLPVFSYYKIEFPDVPKSQGESDQMHYILEQLSEGDTVLSAQACYMEKGSLICNGFRDLGIFRLAQDHEAPKISTTLSSGASLRRGQRISLTAEDGQTHVENLEVTADGRWLCFIRKKNNYYYTIDEHCPKGHVVLKIKATDASGNTKTKEIKTQIL